MEEPKKKKQYKKDYAIKNVEYTIDEKKQTIYIKVDGRPVNTPRPQARANFIKTTDEHGKEVTKNKPIIYNPTEYNDWMKKLSDILEEQGFYKEPLLQEIFSNENGVSWFMRAFYTPKKKQSEQIFKPTVPDSDNIAKAYIDAIVNDKHMPKNEETGYGIKDARVTHLDFAKLYMQSTEMDPFVYIEIKPTIDVLDFLGNHLRGGM